MHTLPQNHLLNDRYVISTAIGKGGFGITYEAYDRKLQTIVCIKELFIAGSSTRGGNYTVFPQTLSELSFADFMERFMEEARQLAKYRHPNIVRVLDIFEENHTAYMVMEFVEGRTLKEIVNSSGPIKEKSALPIIEQLLSAVAEIHSKGMLHRDIKPDNLLITKENRLVLIDFGSAREFAEGKTSNHTSILTPGYAPPEQYSERGQRGTFTDMYGLGATLYFMLTGQKPLAATDRVSEQLQPPHLLNPDISPQLSSIIMLCLQLKGSDRLQNANDFLMLLKKKTPVENTPTQDSVKAVAEEPKAVKIKEPVPVKNTPEPPTADVKKTINLFPWLIRLGLLAVIIIGFLILYDFMYNRVEELETKVLDKLLGNNINMILYEEKGYSVISGIESSGHIIDSLNNSYSPIKAADKNFFSFWGADSISNIKWLKIIFKEAEDVLGLKIHVGSHHPKYPYKGEILDLFYANPRVKTALLEFSSGKKIKVNFKEADALQRIEFKKPIKTDFIKFTVLDYIKGQKWPDDISISEIIPIIE